MYSHSIWYLLHSTLVESGQLIWEECRPCPVFASYTLAFALQLRKKHRKTSVKVAEECQLARRKENVQNRLQSALNRCTVQMFTESEDTRCCVNTIFPPEDGHVNARNMSRIIV